jgi:hypothetical protein
MESIVRHKIQIDKFSTNINIELIDLSGNDEIINLIVDSPESVELYTDHNKLYCNVYGNRYYLCESKINIIYKWYYRDGKIQISGV